MACIVKHADPQINSVRGVFKKFAAYKVEAASRCPTVVSWHVCRSTQLMKIPKVWSCNYFLFFLLQIIKHSQLAVSNHKTLKMEKLTKSGIVRSSWTGIVFKALPATFESSFEFASPLLYYAVRKGILSKCGLHVLVDLLGFFAFETKVGDDHTMPDFVIFFFHFEGLEG